jgi:hypothetical protein
MPMPVTVNETRAKPAPSLPNSRRHSFFRGVTGTALTRHELGLWSAKGIEFIRKGCGDSSIASSVHSLASAEHLLTIDALQISISTANFAVFLPARCLPCAGKE